VALQYGYLGVAVTVFLEGFGVPAAGETAIIAGAGAAGRGELNIVMLGVIAFAAAVCGDAVGYVIGRIGGRRLILRYGRYVRLTPERFGHVEAFMTRNGAKVVVVARFVEGLRQLNGLVAGTTGMPWRRFLVADVIGAVLWVGVWTAVGYVAGDHWAQIKDGVLRYRPYVVAGAVLVVVAVVVWRVRRHRHRQAGQP
jgi:membrane protein DedA with SNARE-associated domain